MAGAVTATLRADITQFEKALGEATTKISGLQKSTAQVNTELKKFGNEFSGANLIRQANTMAKAVEDIGGASRLTAAEQKKLGGTVDEALAKYRALGQEVPPALVKISSELTGIRNAEEAATKAANDLAAAQKKAASDSAAGFEKAGGSASTFKGLLGGIGGAITGAFTIGAVINFAKSIIDLGGQITDLSQRTGLSVEAVQEFKYAAEQTGSSIETFAGGVQKLSEKLGDGSKGTVQAVKELGLSFEKLRTLSPEDAFTAVADALGQVDDAQKQAALGTELMGKKFFEILPTIKTGFSEAREEARKFGQVLSKEDVAALDTFGDRFSALMTSLKVGAATAGVAIGDSLTSGWQRFLATVEAGAKNPASFGVGFLDAAIAQRAALAKQVKPTDGSDENDDSVVRGILAGAKAKTAALSDYTTQLKAAREELEKLSGSERQQIKDAKALGASSEEVALALNAQNSNLKLTAGAIDLYVDGVKQATSALKEGFVGNLRKVAEEAIKTANQIEKLGGVTKLDKEQREAANKILFDGVKAMQALGQSATPAAQKVKALADATFDLKDPLKTAGNNIERMVNELTKLNGPTLEPWLRLRTTLGDFKYDNLQKMLGDIPKVSGEVSKWADEQKRLKDQTDANKKASDQWLGALGDLSGAFTQLAQIGGGSLDGVLGQIAQLIALTNVAAQSGAKIKAGFEQIQAGGKANVAAGALTLGTGVIGAAGSLNQATLVKGRANRAARGAATGAAIGTQILPGYGTLIGAGVGALIGALRNPAFEDVYKRVAKNFGVQLSDESAKAIANLAKASFGNDRSAAEVFSLDTIIGEGGGIKDSNVKQLQARLRDAFSMKEVGKFSKEQLDEVLQKNFGAFATYVDSQTTIASKGFVEILQLAKKFDATTEEMRAFVSGQAGNIGSGIAALTQPLIEQFGGLPAKIAAAKKAAEDAANASVTARGGKKDEDLGTEDRAKVDAADKAKAKAALELAELTAKLASGAKGAQEEFDRLGIIALAGFNAARDAGLGFVEALDQIGPGLDQLIQLQKDLGLEGSAALTELLKFRDLVSQNESLVTSAEALNETMLALSKIGGLTAESFAALEGQATTTFDRLTEAGFSSNEALQLMAGFLENARQASIDLGVPIDENTQKLIDQAEAAGILKASGTDMVSVLKEGLGALIEAVGGALPAAWVKASDAAKAAGQATKDATSGTVEAVGAAAAAVGTLPPALESVGTAARDAGAAIGEAIPAGAAVARGSLTGLGGEELDALAERAATAGAAIGRGISDGAIIARGSLGDLRQLSQEELDAMAGSAEQMSDAFKKSALESAEAVRQSQLDMVVAMVATGRVTKEEAEKMRLQIATKFEEAVKAAKASLGKLPKDIPIDVNFKLTPFPDLPDQPPVVIPVEFEYPDGMGPGQGRDSFPDGYPGRPTGAALGGIFLPRPGGHVIRVAEAGRAERVGPVDELQAAPTRTEVINLNVQGTVNGQELLRFTSRNLPRYISTRTTSEAWRG